MTTVKTKLDQPGADDIPHRPTTDVPKSNVADALQYVFDNAGGGGGGSGAPTDAEYIVSSSNATLTNERVVTNTTTIEWDTGTVGQLKANLAHLGLESLTDPGADRLLIWDNSAGATAFFDVEAPFEFTASRFGLAAGPLEDIWNATYASQDLLYYDGANLVPLNKGANYEFLRVNASGNLEWQALPASSGLGDLLSINDLSDVNSAANSRTNLGVGTGDSPEFAGVNIGHATDTTLTRVSAGVAAIEGDTLAMLTATQTLTNKTITAPLFDSYYDFDEIAAPSAPGAGKLRVWAEDNNGISVLHFKSDLDVDHQLGRDLLAVVRNDTGSTLTTGQVVYVSGSTRLLQLRINESFGKAR